MTKFIHEEFIEMVDKSTWMDETTRKAAIEKAQSMSFFNGFPNELTDDAKLDEYFRDLKLRPDSHLQNVLRIQKFNKNKIIDELHDPIDKADWRIIGTSVSLVNAFYSNHDNAIRMFLT